jgi:hypothetical protein
MAQGLVPKVFNDSTAGQPVFKNPLCFQWFQHLASVGIAPAKVHWQTKQQFNQRKI